MGETAVQRFYEWHARVYDSTRWMILHGRRRAVERLALRPGSRVLEIGCGTGLNFAHVLSRLDGARGGSLTGVDFSQDMLARARRRVGRKGWENVHLVQADATALALNQTFDAILFAYSLTMIPDWPAALERAREHLSPGARLVVLDFGRFDHWGPLAPLMRTWLRSSHVETKRDYVGALRALFDDVTVEHWLGGYNFTATARRREHA